MLFISIVVYSVELLNLVVNLLFILVVEDNELVCINVFIVKVLLSIDLFVMLYIDCLVFLGSGLFIGKYEGEYVFLLLNDKCNGFLYFDVYLLVNLYLISRKMLLDDISYFLYICNGWVVVEN